MTDTKSTANMLRQMAQLAEELEAQGADIISAWLDRVQISVDELEAQGADIIGASLDWVDWASCYLQLSAGDLPASIAERGVNRERCGDFDEIFYIDASGVRVCWLVPRETSND